MLVEKSDASPCGVPKGPKNRKQGLTPTKLPLNLAPDVQEEVLFLPRTTKGRDPIKEADIRPIAKTLDWNKQRQIWSRLGQITIGLQGKTNSS